MKDKKTSDELVKTANYFRNFMTKLAAETANVFAGEISKALSDIKVPKEEDTWEMKCPYKDGDRFYIVNPKGSVKYVFWNNCDSNKKTFNQGNIFPTKKAAKLESRRRNLLTRFRAFRDECNGDWKPDWKPDWRKNDAKYYFYISSTDGEIGINDIYFYETFPLFGYFKNEQDAERAIELFGDEIKELFVDCEV